MNALAATQTAMQGWLLHGDPGITVFVDGEDAAHRLRIYADAYRLRLLEVLGNDFPLTKTALGDDAFDALATGYLREHASTRPSVRHFGRAFPGWLRDATRALPQLARFEWTQGECFDAADAPALGIEHITGLPAEAWPSLRLHLHPSTRLLALACNAPELAEAHASGAALPPLRDAASAHWLLWRSEGVVQWRRLDADETAALHAIAAGESFAQLCERMTDFHGDDGALRAASLLKRWLADGLLAAS